MERQRGKRKVPESATSRAVDQTLEMPGPGRELALEQMNSAIAVLLSKHGKGAFQLDAQPWAGRSYKVSGSAMEGIGIRDGDTVLVDDQRAGISGDLVLVSRDGHRFEVRTLRVEGNTTYLHAESPDLSDEVLSQSSSMKVHGVVTQYGRSR